MKRLLSLLVVFIMAGVALAADGRVEPILKLLNSRASSSLRTYASAVTSVSAAARRGDLLSQYVVAVLSDAADWPTAARLTPREKARYLESTRERIRTLAEQENHAFAWYLLYLENREESCLQKAVDGGNVQALNAAGTRRLMAALQNPEDDEAESVRRTCFGYFKRAADQGDANGLNNLGLCRQNGWGCEKDEAAALDCFRKAAQQGHAEAVNNMGRFFREGIGVKRNLAVALRCFRLSAGQGNVSGELNYALALIRGEGVAADAEKGVAILESAAVRGEVEAMDCLSECYLTGVGEIKPDAMKSTAWLMRARAARGDKAAAEWIRTYDENSHDR